MADMIDNAQKTTDILMRSFVNLSRQPEAPKVVGECLNCGEPLNGRRFCDKHCAADYERDMKKGR